MPRPLTLLAVFAGLLAARLLGAHFLAFYQHDEIALAAGVAALVQDNALADTYRYGPQMGYHRLVQLLDLLLGADPRHIPTIMITLSAIAGALIPTCGLALFPFDLGRGERWALTGLLAVNPILWMSAFYGNSAMPAVALLVLAVTVLSSRPGRGLEVLALVLFGAAILVRADSVLAAPLVGLMLFHQHGLRGAAIRSAILAAGLAAVYAGAFAVDGRMASAVADVADHLTNRFQTHFWEYLIWSMSPFIFILAIGGAFDLLATRRRLLACVGAWMLPFLAFYFGSTTTPRYFVPSVVPLSICAAAGAAMLVRLLAPSRPRMTVAALGLVCSLHLFVGLGWFTPGSWRSVVQEAQFETQVGPMWTGAFLHKTYLEPGLLVRSLRHPGFDRTNATQRALDEALGESATTPAPGGDVVVLLGGWNANMFHYYANAYGARYVSRGEGSIFTSARFLRLGDLRLMSVARRDSAYRRMATLPVDTSDQVWMLGWDAPSELELRAKVPSGLLLTPRGDTTGPVRRWDVQGGRQ